MTARAFRIDPATRADLGEVETLIRELAEYERLGHLCIASRADLEAALFAARPAAEVLIGRVNDQVAGFALFFHNFSTFLGRRGLWLEDLFVRPPFRRIGLGRALLLELAAIARARGCGRFEWAVLDWNAPAIRFYESMGATVLPDWRITRVTGDALARLAVGPGSP